MLTRLRHPLVSTRPLQRSLLLAIAAAGLLAAPPAEARDCAREEAKRLKQLAQHVQRCAGDAGCEQRARTRCITQLGNAGCGGEVCSPPLPGGPNDMCLIDTAEQVVPPLNTVLSDFETPLNNNWEAIATAEGINPYKDVYDGSVKIGSEFCDVFLPESAALCAEGGGVCVNVEAELSVDEIDGLGALQFSDLAVRNVTTEDISAFKNGGPYAGRINADPAPPFGASWNDPANSVVLAVADPRSSIVVDLGQNYFLCGEASNCPVFFGATGNATYRIEHSLEGNVWSTWIDVPTSGGCNCLEQRNILDAFEVETRYLRIYATGGQGEYAVSMLRVFSLDVNGNPVRVNENKPAVGPQPLVASSLGAESGDASDDPRATLLPYKGVESAVTVDLGRPVQSPGGSLFLWRSGNDHYVIDRSEDGVQWVNWVLVPPANPSTKKITSQNLLAPAVASMRYLRIYANESQGSASDGVFSVARLEFPFLSPTGQLIQNVPLDQMLPASATGPEWLLTNTKSAPEQTAWDDTRFAMILPSSLSDAKEGAPIIDLGKAAGRGIDRISIQASANDEYQIDISDDGEAWKGMWKVPHTSTSKDHLTTRNSADYVPGGLLVDPATGRPFVGRYVRAYPVSGDTKHSIAELSIFNNQLERGCPFDASANDPTENPDLDDLNNATCSFSGEATGKASFPSCSGLECITAKATGTIRFECEDILGDKFTKHFETVEGSCSAGSPKGSAVANFCALSCRGDNGETIGPRAALTYGEVASLDLEVQDLVCDVEGIPLFDLDTILFFFKDDIVKKMTPKLEKVLDDLIKSETPFPDTVCNQ